MERRCDYTFPVEVAKFRNKCRWEKSKQSKVARGTAGLPEGGGERGGRWAQGRVGVLFWESSFLFFFWGWGLLQGSWQKISLAVTWIIIKGVGKGKCFK